MLKDFGVFFHRVGFYLHRPSKAPYCLDWMVFRVVSSYR